MDILIYRRVILLFLFCSLFVSPGHCEKSTLSRLVVLPFNYIGLPEADAAVATGVVEATLTTTGVFEIPEKNELVSALSEREFLLYQCTSRECADQLGQLVSADQVVTGKLSRRDEEYTVEIVIFHPGREIDTWTLRETSKSLSSLYDAVETAVTGWAFRMLGKSKTQSDLYIETKPSGADVFIDGRYRGRSPLHIGDAPAARIEIEAQTSTLYGKSEFEITETADRVVIPLDEVSGGLVIRSNHRDVHVYLDDTYLGELGDGFFGNVPAGIRSVTLKNPRTYWRDQVKLKAEEIVEVEARPKPFGVLLYDFPEGAAAEISGDRYREVVVGTGVLSPMYAGDYLVSLRGGIFQPETSTISVEEGAYVAFKPRPNYSREYELATFNDVITYGEDLLRLDLRVEQHVIDRMVRLLTVLRSSIYDFPELYARAEILIPQLRERKALQDTKNQIASLNRRKWDVSQQLDDVRELRKTYSTLGWISSGVGVLSLALAGVFRYSSNLAYEDYLNASITEQVIHYREEMKLWQTAAWISLGTGGIAAAGSVLLFSLGPRTHKHEAELSRLDERIEELESGLP